MATFPADSVRTKNWGTEILTDADLEGQFDLIHEYIKAALNSSSGHTHDGTSNQGPKLSPANMTIASQAQGDILYASTASAWARLGAGTSGYLLKTNGTGANPAWVNIAADSTYLPAGSVVQVVNTQTGAVSTGTTVMPYDNSIPQSGEGDEYMTLSITPKSATNKLLITCVAIAGFGSSASGVTMALFQDSTAGALAAVSEEQGSSGAGLYTPTLVLNHYMTSGTTSDTTFKIRIGSHTSGTTTFNGAAGTRLYGGVAASSITIQEIKV